MVDQWTRLNTLYWVVDKDGRRVLFVMNLVQQMFMRGLHVKNVILKARQFGFTTLICLLGLDRVLFEPDVRVGIIAHNLDDAKVFFRDKVKYAYDHLPPTLKEMRPLLKSDANELMVDHGDGRMSGIRVGTTLLSGTLQMLHISEYGKICEKEPDKAAEIKRSALNTVGLNNMVFVESTGRGGESDFKDMCDLWRGVGLTGRPLGPMDYKFWFFPWHWHGDYESDVDRIVWPEADLEYFRRFEAETGVVLTERKKAWYSRKKLEQKDKMWSEYPGTPEEAFSVVLEGAYYSRHVWQAREEGRVRPLECEAGVAVDTAWDLGVNNAMVVILFQVVEGSGGQEVRVLDCLEGCGVGLRSYAERLWRLRDERGYRYGRFYAPHDVAVRELTTGRSRLEAAKDMGVYFELAPRLGFDDGVEAVWEMFPRVWFDERRCGRLLDALSKYRRKRDARTGMWSSEALHDWCCLSGETRIRTLNGWIPIRDLVGKDFHVWGYDLSQHRLMPAKAAECRKTKTVGGLVKVTLDDGASVTCTPDHRFLSRDERWICAGDLTVGQSLMPFYEREEGKRRYKRIHLNDGSITDEHKFVYSQLCGFLIEGRHIHHIDGDKHNNNPGNLACLTQMEHTSIHASEPGRLARFLKQPRPGNPAAAAQLTAVNKMRSGDNHHTRREGYYTDELRRKIGDKSRQSYAGSVKVKKCVGCGGDFMGNWKREFCCYACKASHNRRMRGIPESPYRVFAHRPECLRVNHNHKVASVEVVPGEHDVYDILVPSLSNFVAEGVVVHNSDFADAFRILAICRGLGGGMGGWEIVDRGAV